MASGTALRVRVWVPDMWDNVVLDVTSDHSVARLKQEALEAAFGTEKDSSQFQVKFRGALVTNEKLTLGDLDVPDNAPFIILPARRRPVR